MKLENNERFVNLMLLMDTTVQEYDKYRAPRQKRPTDMNAYKRWKSFWENLDICYTIFITAITSQAKQTSTEQSPY
jgi:hypothetical protein